MNRNRPVLLVFKPEYGNPRSAHSVCYSRPAALRRTSRLSHRRRDMPLGPFEREVLRLLAINRNADSYVGGATVLLQSPVSPRSSEDIDLVLSPSRGLPPVSLGRRLRGSPPFESAAV